MTSWRTPNWWLENTFDLVTIPIIVHMTTIISEVAPTNVSKAATRPTCDEWPLDSVASCHYESIHHWWITVIHVLLWLANWISEFAFVDWIRNQQDEALSLNTSSSWTTGWIWLLCWDWHRCCVQYAAIRIKEFAIELVKYTCLLLWRGPGEWG